jgi:hypothetical protein
LRSHAIPQDAYDALVKHEHAEFIRRRQQYLIDLERTFMEREKVTLPSEMNVPQFAPIDTDDVAPPSEPLAFDE